VSYLAEPVTVLYVFSPHKAGLIYLFSSLIVWTSWNHMDVEGLAGLLRMFLALALAMPTAAVLATAGSLNSDLTLLLGYLLNAVGIAVLVDRRSRRRELIQRKS
jgi:hypothetical protein